MFTDLFVSNAHPPTFSPTFDPQQRVSTPLPRLSTPQHVFRPPSTCFNHPVHVSTTQHAFQPPTTPQLPVSTTQPPILTLSYVFRPPSRTPTTHFDCLRPTSHAFGPPLAPQAPKRTYEIARMRVSCLIFIFCPRKRVYEPSYTRFLYFDSIFGLETRVRGPYTRF